MLVSICRTCIQVQFDVSALQSAPHLDDLFLHRERKELESGAPAALGEGAFAGTRLVRRFRPMDEHERGGRGLYRWRRKPSASEIDDRKFRKSRFRKTPLSTGASNIITCCLLAHDVLTHIEAVQKFTRCNPTDVHKKASITVPGDLKTGPFSSHDSPEHLAVVVELLVVAPVLAVLVEVVVAHAVLVVVEVLLVLVRGKGEG